MHNVIIDTGFFVALFNGKDSVEINKAEEVAELISDENIIVPFPILYEFVNSKLSRKEAKYRFESFLKRPNVFPLSDAKYKDEALNAFFEKARRSYNDYSLVDEVIKLVLEDKDIKIDYIASFDNGLKMSALSKGVKCL